MTSDQIGSLAYLALLLVAVAGWFVASNRQSLNKVAQQTAIWLFIFLGAIVAVGLWMDIRDDILPQHSVAMDGQTIEVPRAADGHYYLTVEVNGMPLRFVVDTGASQVVLTQEDAARVGVDLETLIYSGRASTANGVVETAPVRLDHVALGGIEDRDVRAVVNRGAMEQSLLGMSYLGRYARIEIAGGTLVLER